MSDLCKEREQIMKKFKSSILITSDSFKDFGCSEYLIILCKQIQDIQNDPKTDIDKTTAMDVSDYVMMILTFTNCLRSSNIVNINLHEKLNAKEHEEIKNAYYFRNTLYKTSLIYGEKIIVVPKDIYQHINK